MPVSNVQVVKPRPGDAHAVIAVSFTNERGTDKFLPFSTLDGLARWFERHGLLLDALQMSSLPPITNGNVIRHG